jgi:biotin operon repressor
VTDTAGRLLAMLPLRTARPTWRGDKPAARLGVPTRTVRQDVGRLRELGYPVRAVPGPQGGYALSAGTRLPPLLVDDDDAVAVALGLRAAAADPGLCDMEPAAAIEQVMPSRLRRRVAAPTSTTVPLASAGERSRRHPEPYRPTRPTPPGSSARACPPDRTAGGAGSARRAFTPLAPRNSASAARCWPRACSRPPAAIL